MRHLPISIPYMVKDHCGSKRTNWSIFRIGNNIYGIFDYLFIAYDTGYVQSVHSSIILFPNTIVQLFILLKCGHVVNAYLHTLSLST